MIPNDMGTLPLVGKSIFQALFPKESQNRLVHWIPWKIPSLLGYLLVQIGPVLRSPARGEKPATFLKNVNLRPFPVVRKTLPETLLFVRSLI